MARQPSDLRTVAARWSRPRRGRTLSRLLAGTVLSLASTLLATAAEQPELVIREASRAYANADYEHAFDLAAPMADIGLPEGRHLLGRLHLNREFSGFDVHEAFRLLELAAKQGLPAAQHDLAEMYRSGIGVQRDPLAAFGWHLRAARQHHQRSELAIAQMYASGEGVALNAAQAETWRARARAPRSEQQALQRRATTAGRARPTVGPAAAGAGAGPPLAAPGADAVVARAASAVAANAGRPTQDRSDVRPPPGTGDLGAPVPRAGLTGHYRVQLGAYRSRVEANRAIARVAAALPEQARSRYEITLQSVDLGDGKGLLHRIQAGPVPDLASAQFVCRQVTRSMPRNGCFVLRSR